MVMGNNLYFVGKTIRTKTLSEMAQCMILKESKTMHIYFKKGAPIWDIYEKKKCSQSASIVSKTANIYLMKKCFMKKLTSSICHARMG